MSIYLLDELILGFCYSNLAWETGGFKLTLTITMPSYFWEVFINLVVVVLSKIIQIKVEKHGQPTQQGLNLVGRDCEL